MGDNEYPSSSSSVYSNGSFSTFLGSNNNNKGVNTLEHYQVLVRNTNPKNNNLPSQNNYNTINTFNPAAIYNSTENQQNDNTSPEYYVSTTRVDAIDENVQSDDISNNNAYKEKPLLYSSDNTQEHHDSVDIDNNTRHSNKDAESNNSIWSDALNIIIIYTIDFITKMVFLKIRGGRWAAKTNDVYVLKNGQTYALPIWYKELRDFILHFWLQFFLITFVAIICYYGLPYIARFVISGERRNGLFVCKVDFLSGEHIPKFVELYRQTGQTVYSDLIADDNKKMSSVRRSGDLSTTDSTDSVIGKSNINGVPSGIDTDDNNLDDDLEEKSMDTLLQSTDIITANNNIKSTPNSENSISKRLTPAPPVNVPTNHVCGMLTQYEPTESLLRRRKGCFDLIYFMLHRAINPSHMNKIVHKRIELSRQASKAATSSKKYLASKKALEIDKANKELNRMATTQSNQAMKYTDKHTHCVCNTHLGIAEPFIYVGYNGEDPLMIIEPILEPLPKKQLDRIRDSGMQTSIFRPSNITSKLLYADKGLWSELKFTSQIQQPQGISLTYKTLPTDQTMNDYYGDLLGAADAAFLNAHSNLLQIKRLYESGLNMNKTNSLSPSFVSGIFNSVVDSLVNYANPNSQELDAYHDIIQWRYDTHIARRMQQDHNGATKKVPSNPNKIGGFAAGSTTVKNNGPKSTTDQILYTASYLADFIVSIGGNATTTANLPELIQIKNKEFEGPMSGCIMHCMGLNEANKKRRQEWRNSLMGDETSTASLRSSEVQRLNFQFV